MSALRVTGRLCLAALFVNAGFKTATDPGKRGEMVEKAGLPRGTELVRFNGAAMVAGGLGLATGVLDRAAALGLVASLIPTTYVGHRFWEIDEPQPRAMQLTHFMKNLAIIGGLLVYAGSED